MELSALAARVLLSAEIDRKLRPPRGPLTDESPGSAVRVALPARPRGLRFRYRKNGPKLPRGDALRDRGRRGVAHHILANHELQAAEVMAAVLLAFPRAPAAFRAELGAILCDELRHTRMHLARAEACGTRFGDHTVNGHVWRSAARFRDEAEYLCVLPLVFEARNLDESLELAALFDAAGDPKGAGVMRAIHEDEIEHVAFGLRWLGRFAPAPAGGTGDEFDVWASRLEMPNQPARAVGRTFLEPPRRAAGMSDAFLAKLRRAAAAAADGSAS
ncbi:DUF455 family protein [Alienimonas californiensis]|uniref:DUF455 domain-containing protein n=1 Tax=Alienimonas californiensis TaxID=2527989 RepID=A0A517PAC4_9PLAN|nr:DUF455 family protein [Alienimonas californiensis]QDT16327.1 hypothetical protein CA12_24280 [Alienimonas californiensis]